MNNSRIYICTFFLPGQFLCKKVAYTVNGYFRAQNLKRWLFLVDFLTTNNFYPDFCLSIGRRIMKLAFGKKVFPLSFYTLGVFFPCFPNPRTPTERKSNVDSQICKCNLQFRFQQALFGFKTLTPMANREIYTKLVRPPGILQCNGRLEGEI